MKLSDRCYAVTGLGYSAPWSVNAGFVVGDDDTLVVDTGARPFPAPPCMAMPVPFGPAMHCA